jgi:ABC-type dipeptide/oligopeptide/nickel transport system permease component
LVLFIGFVTVVTNFLVDILYVALDPRIKYE